MELLKVFLLFCLMAEGFTRKTQTLRQSTGNIVEKTSGDNSYRIRVSRGSRIVFSLNLLQLGRKASLTLRDGKSGLKQIYKMRGSSIYKISGTNRTRVWLPTTMETETEKLFITERKTKPGDGFTAHYTSYASDGCQKDQIADDFEYDVVEKSCDTDEHSPTAINCELTIPCEDNYVQYNKKISCVRRRWVGKIDCQPDGDLIKRCSYDFDQFTTNEGCLFSNSQVAQYYVNVEGADVFERSLGRSTDRPIDCSSLCAHGSRGGFIQQQCPTSYHDRSTLASYVKCLICRILKNCERTVVFM